ncbi:DUF927 domain-containing protein [Prolixibacteraceae bacterium Z1-6]|uniref:DUF927 domain-containing protein n=1 Tax=Draconibacterium aestuarii TaxID=2998507 RepID=A0A9X3F8W3_9BACT|nr:DUF927 domain-containing protein [Prolixibacteraceae bacterium Z1-6]
MDYKELIPDSENPSEDQKKNGFFIEGGKYFLEETRGRGTRKKELSNFVMQSIFHLNNGTNNSKRIIKIQRYTGEISFIEVYSSEMKHATFETFLKSIRCTFIGGTENLNLIFARLMDDENEAFYIDVLGWIPEHNIYAFADSVITQSNQVEKVNELGIITDANENKSYYLPSFGIANINDAGHDTNRLYKFRAGNLSFESWSQYYFQSFESNGIIGILFLILSVFRDIVFNQVGFFPFLFLHGDYGTGKTSFVERLLSVFGKDTIGTALNNATITALSRIVSTRLNSLFYFKEYTSDTEESAQDFILTAYDGAGRTTGVKSNDNRTQSLVIKSGIILDGNELPVEKSAVFSRMILASFEKQNFSDEQKEAFEKLKSEAEFGLGNILLEILKYRELFATNFKEAYSENLKNLKQSELSKNLRERMLNHVALLLAPAKILDDKLTFPFSFKEATLQIIDRALNQDELLKESNAVTVFWNAIAYGIRNATVNQYDEGLNNSKADFRVKYDSTGDGILQIKYPNLYPKYVSYCKSNNIKFLDKNSLKSLLTSEANKSFIRSSQQNRGSAYTDFNFGSCYQFAFQQKEKGIEVNEVELYM